LCFSGIKLIKKIFFNMGESDRYIEYKHLGNKKKFSVENNHQALFSLIILNIVCFLILFFIQVSYSFYDESYAMFTQKVLTWFQLPTSFNEIIYKPWTALTYMFCDTSASIWRLVSNMIWLWSFGILLQEMIGNDKIVPLYIYGGIVGALFFLGSNMVLNSEIQSNSLTLIGANSACLAIASAATFFQPNYRLLTHIRKGIPLWVLFILYVLIDWMGISNTHFSILLAHAGGLLAGVLFILLLKNNIDLSTWMNKLYYFITQFFTPKKTNPKSIKNQIFYNSGDVKPFDKKMKLSQQKIDELLDKINLQGIDSLTDEEKAFLKKASESQNLE